MQFRSILVWLARNAFLRALPAVFIGVAAGLGMVWAFAPAPIRLTDVREVDGITTQGGVIELAGTVIHARPCITAVHRWLWRDRPGHPGEFDYFYLQGAPYSPPLPVGTVKYTISIPTPAYVPEGEYHYVGEAEDKCPLLPGLISPRSRLSPDVLVRVMKSGPDSPAAVVVPDGPVTIIPAITAR